MQTCNLQQAGISASGERRFRLGDDGRHEFTHRPRVRRQQDFQRLHRRDLSDFSIGEAAAVESVLHRVVSMNAMPGLPFVLCDC